MISSKLRGLASSSVVRGDGGQRVMAPSSMPTVTRRALLPRLRSPTPSVTAALPVRLQEAPLPRRRPSPTPRLLGLIAAAASAAPAAEADAKSSAAAAKAAGDKAVVVDHVQAALADLEDESLVVFAATAPAVRVAIGEALAQATGQSPAAASPATVQPGQLVSALRLLGFDYVFDVATGADLTIMEEAYELLARLTERAEAVAAAGVEEREEEEKLGSGSAAESKKKSASGGSENHDLHPHDHHGPLPMFTSCCPGWVALVEGAAPELLPHVSSCKSPHLMLGAVLKRYFAPNVLRIDPRRVRVVSVMPCVKKQAEADRPGNEWAGLRDVDHVITTRELAEILKSRGIVDLAALPVDAYDDPLSPRRRTEKNAASSSSQSGSGVLFGTTGGVMEAALRTVYEAVTGEKLAKLEFEACRGLEGVKETTVHLKLPKGSPLLGGGGGGGGGAEASSSSPSSSHSPASPSAFPPPLHATAVPLAGMDDTLHLRVAVCNGLGNAKKLLAGIKDGTAPPYDFVECMACPAGCIGGGGQPRPADKGAIAARQAALYSLDERATVRHSHENPAVRFLYEKFLGEPLSVEAEAHLHTSYGVSSGGKEGEKGVSVPSSGVAPKGAAAADTEGGKGGEGPRNNHHECQFCGALVEEGGCGAAAAAD